jgi:hypothetical protein
MTGDSRIFTVDEVGRRAVVRFRDWKSSSDAFFGPWEDFACDARSELESLTSEHDCTTLAIDISPIDLVPSSFLGLLVSLHRSGLEIELLHASKSVREILDRTQLNRVLKVRD